MKERPMSCQLGTVCSSTAGKRIAIRPGITLAATIPALDHIGVRPHKEKINISKEITNNNEGKKKQEE